MPKMKTHKAAAKRYKVHLLQHKSGSRKRKIFGDIAIADSQVKLVSYELPYKKYSR